MSYTFNNKNLLITKESYMYSPYHGKVLFSYFLKNRSNYLYRLEFQNDLSYDLNMIKFVNLILSAKINYRFNKKLFKLITSYKKDILIKDGLNFTSNKIKIKNCEKKNVINTDNLLKNLISSSLNNRNTKEIYKFTEKLINKFEVSKRLFNNYDKNFKKIGKRYKNIELYKKFSILLSINYILKKNNRYLNTLLKVNDLISSTEESVKNLNHNELIIIFGLEEFFIKDLLKINKIKL